MLFQETVKDCPGLLNCTVGLAGGSSDGSMNERGINQGKVNNLEECLLQIQHKKANKNVFSSYSSTGVHVSS